MLARRWMEGVAAARGTFGILFFRRQGLGLPLLFAFGFFAFHRQPLNGCRGPAPAGGRGRLVERIENVELSADYVGVAFHSSGNCI